MANAATKVVKKAAKKTTKKAVKGGVNYAKGWVTKAILCWAIAAGIGILKNTYGIPLPEFLTGGDTIAMGAFVLAGFICYGRKVSPGRAIAFIRTMLN